MNKSLRVHDDSLFAPHWRIKLEDCAKQVVHTASVNDGTHRWRFEGKHMEIIICEWFFPSCRTYVATWKQVILAGSFGSIAKVRNLLFTPENIGT